MLFRGDKFGPSGVAEYLKLFLTILAAAAQVGLNIALAVLIGSNFRSHAPWALYLVIALACAWAIALLVLIASLVRLVRFLNKGREVLQTARSSLILPLGAESLAVAVGSALLSSAVVWISTNVKDNAGTPEDLRYGQFDVYFPISIGFQILALPGFVKLSDMFGYAQAKAKKELQNALLRADTKHSKQKLYSLSTGNTSLMSAESIRAAQKEIGLAKARLSQQERALLSISTGGSSQAGNPAGQGNPAQQGAAPQRGGSSQTSSPQRVFTRPLVPLSGAEEHGEDRRDRMAYKYKPPAPEQSITGLKDLDDFDNDNDDDLEAQRDTKLEIYSSLPTRGAKTWF